MANIVTVDDTNTVQLKYDDKWFHGNWTDASTQPPSNKSLLSSNDVTAQLVLVFPVAGIGFSYYGMRRSGGGRFRICVDCDPNQPAGPFDMIDALNVTDNGQNPPALLYSKQGLKNDIHTVVLINSNDTRIHPQGASQITLDRFEIITQDPPAVTITNTVQSVPTGSLIPNTTNTPSGRSVNPGLIAGVVIGALALVALLVGLFLCWRRKRRTTAVATIEEGLKSREIHTPQPFIIRRLQHGHRPSLSVHPPPSSNSLTAPNSSLETTSSPAAVLPSTSFPTNHRRVERDAGPAHEVEDDDEGTLPPDYAQVYNLQSTSETPPGLSPRLPRGENNGFRHNSKLT